MPSRSDFVVLPLVTVAVLSRLAVWPLIVTVQPAMAGAPAAGAVVGDVTWTDAEAPAARLPKLQVRFVPATWQALAGELEATVHAMPRPAIVGRGSFRVTALSVVLPVFVAVIVKPIGLPAVTDTLSAVLTTLSPG